MYAGGIIYENDIKSLGIKQKDIIEFLILVINKLQNQTRLFNNCNFQLNENWVYSYKIIDHEESIPLTTAKEEIFYKDKMVFILYFLLCPII